MEGGVASIPWFGHFVAMSCNLTEGYVDLPKSGIEDDGGSMTRFVATVAECTLKLIGKTVWRKGVDSVSKSSAFRYAFDSLSMSVLYFKLIAIVKVQMSQGMQNIISRALVR
jgi:hypothetical protein